VIRLTCSLEELVVALAIYTKMYTYNAQEVIVCYRYDRLHNKMTICMVGKYTTLEDSYTSVTKSLQHAALFINYKVNIVVSGVAMVTTAVSPRSNCRETR